MGKIYLVDTNRKINGKPLSSDVNLKASDVGALAEDGIAVKASALATGRTFSLTGDATGTSASWTGSGNASIPVTLSTVNSTTGSFGPTGNSSPGFGDTIAVPQVTVDAKGRVTASYSRTITLPSAPTTVSGNAGSATKLQTTRTIDGISFDGTANIHHYGTCTSAATAAAKVATVSGTFTLSEGAVVHIKMTNSNSVASPTLNVNSTGAKTIYRYGSTAPSTSATSSWNAGAIVTFIYDGSNWYIAGWLNNNTTYSVFTGSSSTTAGTTGLVPAPSAGDQSKFLRADGIWVVPTDTNTNYYPTTWTWTGGTTAGPTASITGSGMSAVSVAAIPAASSSASGIVTTGVQRFKGEKQLEYPTLTSNNTRYLGATYKNNALTKVGEHWYDIGDPTNITTGIFNWRQYSPNSTPNTTTTGYYETFYLPEVDKGRTANASYGILTTKNHASPNKGTANKLAYYSSSTAIASYDSTVGGSTTRPIYLNAGVPTAITSLAIGYGGTGATTALAGITALGGYSILNFGTVIPNNADLNTYITPGTYYIASSAGSKTLQNCPYTESGFKLLVEQTYSANYKRQIAWFGSGTSTIYVRCTSTNGETWNDWTNIVVKTTAGSITGTTTGNLALTGGTMTGTINSQSILPKTTRSYALGGTSNYWTFGYFGTGVLVDNNADAQDGYKLRNGNSGSLITGRLYNVTLGTTSVDGEARFQIGNGTASGTAGNAYGRLMIYNTDSTYKYLRTDTSNTSGTCYLPSAGTAYLIGASSTDAVGGSTRPVYVSDTGIATAITSLAVDYGGTGATTAANARTNLSVYSKSEVDTKVTATDITSSLKFTKGYDTNSFVYRYSGAAKPNLVVANIWMDCGSGFSLASNGTLISGFKTPINSMQLVGYFHKYTASTGTYVVTTYPFLLNTSGTLSSLYNLNISGTTGDYITFNFTYLTSAT